MIANRNQQLNFYPYQNFTCDSCGREFYQETAYSATPNLDQTEGYLTYCLNCVKINKEKTSRKKIKDFGSPPTEASENLHSLEIDKRTLRKTGRVKQFNTSVSEE